MQKSIAEHTVYQSLEDDGQQQKTTPGATAA